MALAHKLRDRRQPTPSTILRLLPGVGMPKLPKPLVRCDQGFLLTPLSVDGRLSRDSQNRFHDLKKPLRHLEIRQVAGLMERDQDLVR